MASAGASLVIPPVVGPRVARLPPPLSLSRRLKYALIRAYFAATLVVSIALVSLVSRIIKLLFFVSEETRGAWAARAAGLGFKLIMVLNPQIRVEYADHQAGRPPWHELFADKNSRPLVLINHTSTFDALFYSATLPLSVIGRLKTLAKAGLFKVPLFGTILDACGHFPVYFAKESVLGEFSVNKDLQDKVMAKLEAHVLAGGGLSMFPEGQINRANTAELQAFRRGTFAVARKHNMQIWAYLHTGVEDFWPMNVRTVGGFPSKVLYKLFKVPMPPPDVDLAGFVDHIQRVMQLELDVLYMMHRNAPASELAEARARLQSEIKVTAHGDAAVRKQLEEGVSLETGDVRSTLSFKN